MSHVHQLLHMATQLRRDASNAQNHKYLAHRIALMYQCLNQVRGESKPFKKRIEEQFETIKRFTETPAGVAATPGGGRGGGGGREGGGGKGGAGALPPRLRQWLEDVTEEVAALVRQYPPGMTEKMRPLLRALAHEEM